MTRFRKIGLIVAASLAGLALAVIIGGLVIVQTDWFRNMVRAKIVAAAEDATGGKTEIGSFSFEWRHLRAQVRNFVIHGLEPVGAPPLFRANLVEADLKLISPFSGFVNLAYLLLDTPQANVIVYPDGSTNIPAPKVKPKSSNKTGLETIVDLAIGHFDLRNGSLTFADRKMDLNASGSNFRAQLGYDAMNPSYAGEIDISPLNLKYGANLPLDVDVKLPVRALKDRIELTNAQLSTPQSRIVVSGAMDHLIAPHTSAHLNARIGLDEVRRAAGLTTTLDTAHGPSVLTADVAASMDSARIQVQTARIRLGQSNIEASGTLKDTNRSSALQFNSTLALSEIGRLLRVAARPEGTARIGGNASLDANNNYFIRANLDARHVAFQQGSTALSGIDLGSAIEADPRRIALNGLRLSALGGDFTGDAALQDMAQFHLAGSLHNFDIAQVMQIVAHRPLGYDGIVSGPVQADGNVENLSALAARANLAIAPGPHGIPVTGRIDADYQGQAGAVTLANSYIALPHTRLDVSGSLGETVQVKLVSRDFADFRPVAAIPITFESGGSAVVNAAVTGNVTAPRIAGNVAVIDFAVENRPFNRFTAAVNASPSSAAIQNAVLSRGNLQARFSASAGLHDWKPLDNDPLRADATIRNADLKDVLALAGQADLPMSGALTADAHVNGTIGGPRGSASFSVLDGTLEGERFDSLTAHATMTDRAITVPSLAWIAGPSRLDANAEFQHPLNDLKQGTITAHVATNQIQIAQFHSLVRDRPGLRGIVTVNADATANMQPSGVEVASLNANIGAHGLQMQGKSLGDLTATANTAGGAIRYNAVSDFVGSNIRVNGQSELAGNHQTRANAVISNLPIDRVLAVAGEGNLPVTGTLAASAQMSGTLQDPHATLSLTIDRGSAYREPFTRLQAAVNYSNQLIDVPQFHIDDGPSSVDLAASFAHPANDLHNGEVKFRVRSNPIQLGRIHAVQEEKPGLNGVLQLTADGAATLRTNRDPLFSSLDVDFSANGLSMNRQNLGDVTATVSTRGGTAEFNLKSDLGRANIQGNGRVQLAGDYPVTAQLSFSNLTYRGLSPLLGTAAQPFDASTDGQVNVSGPISNASQLRASARLTKLEAHSVPTQAGAPPRTNFHVDNAGDIVVALANNTVTVRSFRLSGPSTNFALSGTASLQAPQAINVHAEGNLKLDALEAFNSSIFSSGNVALNATVTGTTAKPEVLGTLQLQKASFNMMDLPNGLSNANGAIAFNRTQAIIQDITGETGGGKVTLTGEVTYGGPQRQFRVQATANRVRIEYPQTVTTEVSARLSLDGTSTASLVTGTVMINDVALHSSSDMGSILTSVAPPPSSSPPSTGLLAGMRFDIHILTAPGVQFRTTLTQDLQADADLTLRGTPDRPGMLGRVTVTEGEVVFFGNKYTINQGAISFFDPHKIEPVLNIDLETTVQGVDVSLSVSGPVDRMKLSYRSDPPLQFQQIVSLLASGKAPTTDPVLAAHQPAAPAQNLEQAGASTLLGQAVANPVSGQLQRLFGVTKLSIDPQIIGTTNTPQATLTLQQQITREITFTYIQDVTQSNPQIIRVEWAINPQWSVVLLRDINAEFNMNFFYKKRFR
jgi:translocation and assembly module TamB